MDESLIHSQERTSNEGPGHLAPCDGRGEGEATPPSTIGVDSNYKNPRDGDGDGDGDPSAS
jgi:hypothetical protein